MDWSLKVDHYVWIDCKIAIFNNHFSDMQLQDPIKIVIFFPHMDWSIEFGIILEL